MIQQAPSCSFDHHLLPARFSRTWRQIRAIQKVRRAGAKTAGALLNSA